MTTTTAASPIPKVAITLAKQLVGGRTPNVVTAETYTGVSRRNKYSYSTHPAFAVVVRNGSTEPIILPDCHPFTLTAADMLASGEWSSWTDPTDIRPIATAATPLTREMRKQDRTALSVGYVNNEGRVLITDSYRMYASPVGTMPNFTGGIIPDPPASMRKDAEFALIDADALPGLHQRIYAVRSRAAGITLIYAERSGLQPFDVRNLDRLFGDAESARYVEGKLADLNGPDAGYTGMPAVEVETAAGHKTYLNDGYLQHVHKVMPADSRYTQQGQQKPVVVTERDPDGWKAMLMPIRPPR